MAARRIDPAEAREHVERGALLVCAYDDDEKCRDMLLEGAGTLSELKAREGSLPRDQELIFYCA
jgi:hypothetical protein